MPDFKDVDTTRRGDDKIKRDQWGRYVLPHPETGKVQSWTRATTVAGTVKDRFALEKWDQRNIIFGIGQRPDLYARAAAAKRSDDDTLAEIAEQAKNAAASQSGAILGSALHQFMERVDAGEELTIPEPYRRDVDAYVEACKAAGIVTALGWIERVVIVPDLGIAGQLDRVVNGMWSLPRIGDIKTSSKDSTDFTKYGIDIPIQLGIYANATHWWAGEETGWVEMPTLDRDKAMVMHVPAGRGECLIYEVDIAAGWEAVQLAIDVREWRKRRDLFEMVPLFATASEVTEDELRERVERIKAHSDQARQWLAARWPVGIPTFKHGGPRDMADVEKVVEIVTKTEEQFGIEIAGDGAAEPVAEEEGGTSSRSDGCQGPVKGGEAVSPSAEDPPASPSSSPNGSAGDGHGAQGDPATGPSMPVETPVAGTSDENSSADDGHGAQGDPATREGMSRHETPVVGTPRFEWLRARVDAIKASELNEIKAHHTDDMTPRKRLSGLWSLRDEIPTFKQGGPRTVDELEAVIGMCDLVEMEFELPFGPSDPTTPEPEPGSARKS